MKLRVLWLVALATTISGCATAPAPAPTVGENPVPKEPAYGRVTKVSEPMLTCSEATRAARDAVVYLGYTISSVEAAKPDKPGIVLGQRDSGWAAAAPEAGTLYTLKVTIRCSDAGSEIEAATDEGLATQLRFPSRFAAAIKQQAETKPRQVAGHDEQPQGLIINVEPLRSAAARRELGEDLPAAGVTPVRFEIINRSQRRYRFRRDDVELVATQGGREAPLSAAAAAARLALPAGSTALQSMLAEKQIQDGEIKPAATLRGFLYFKAAAYKKARVELLDIEADESEGFSVEF